MLAAPKIFPAERDDDMDVGQIPLFQLLTGRMSWLSSRQAVLSENVANADTPNFVARDMTPMDFEELLKKKNTPYAAATTDVRHIAIRSSLTSPYPAQDAVGEGGNVAGNVVSLEQEMIKLSDTQIQYQTATNLYQKAVNMFRTALGGRS
jgi:flagellar basal-body rod protein FlgB